MKDNISRRDFLKKAGAGTAAAGALALAGACAPKKTAETILNDDSGKDVLEDGKMEMRVNPGNGDSVSLLGYGCMRFTMTKDKDGNDIVDQKNADELIDFALAHGVNYYDTSPVYLRGLSEEAVGNALSRHPRDSYYIATKLSNFSDHSKKASMQLYYDSFRYLQTDYIDYYLLHSLGRGGLDAFDERFVDNGMMDLLQADREKGKIRQLGLSFHGSKEQFDELMKLHDKYHWDFVQIQMNYCDWKHADGKRNANAEYLYDELDKREIPIVIMEPLQGGRLADPAEIVVNKLKERDPEASLASWAFRFVGSYPRILTVLSGMVYQEHLEDNLRTFKDFRYLTDEEKEFLGTEIAGLMATFPTIDCNDCKYCMPCPYGVNIPEIFKHYNKCVNQGNVALNSEQENYRALRRAYLVSYDRAVESLRQANHCIGCRKCVEHCPQSIAIPRELRRIDAYVEKLKRGTL